MKKRVCIKCGQKKPLGEFYKNKANRNGYVRRCKECARLHNLNKYKFNKKKILAKNKRWRDANRPKIKNAVLKRYYGITLKFYKKLLQKQNYKCAICKRKFNFDKPRQVGIDHEHRRGFIRGILCRDCNLLLAYCKDSIELLLSAINYLKTHK